MVSKLNFNFKKREIHPPHHHVSLLLIITIFLIVIISILIKPALLGYRISKQIEDIGIKPADFLKSIDALRSKVLIAETNLETSKSLNEDLLKQISIEKNSSFSCLQEQNILRSKYDQIIQQYEFNITQIGLEFEQKKNEIEAKLSMNNLLVNETINRYNQLLRNSANNICCKAKVDDKRIDSYIISGDTIVCTSGEENKITC